MVDEAVAVTAVAARDRRIVIAAPHKRLDTLETAIHRRLPGREIRRVRARSELVRAVEKVNPRYVFFPHWSWHIPTQVHKNFECVIFHMTDLPYGRGGSPLQNLILRGHQTTVLTAFQCVDELDAGPVYLKQQLSLDGTADQILSRAADVMEDMIVQIVEAHLRPVAQHGDVVAFSRRQPSDGNVAMLQSLNDLYDYIRMLDGEGYPRAFLETPNLRLEFSRAENHGDSVEAAVTIKVRK